MQEDVRDKRFDSYSVTEESKTRELRVEDVLSPDPPSMGVLCEELLKVRSCLGQLPDNQHYAIRSSIISTKNLLGGQGDLIMFI
jgi:hypothetical protein